MTYKVPETIITAQVATVFSVQVVSDKRLLKDLQKEVARLEAKLQSPESSSSSCLKSLLLEKDLKIQQVCLFLD